MKASTYLKRRLSWSSILTVPCQMPPLIPPDFSLIARYFRFCSTPYIRGGERAIRTSRNHCNVTKSKFYNNDFERTATVGTKIIRLLLNDVHRAGLPYRQP